MKKKKKKEVVASEKKGVSVSYSKIKEQKGNVDFSHTADCSRQGLFPLGSVTGNEIVSMVA